MFDDLIPIGTIAIASAFALSIATAQSAEDAFPRFQANAAAALAAKAPGVDALRLTFTNPAVAAGAAQMYGANAVITVAAFDTRACRFSVKVEDPAAQLPPALLTGACEAVARIPVAAANVLPGELITAATLIEAEVPVSRLPANAIRLSADVIGKTPRQPIVAGRPILSTMVKTKPVIEKGQAVTLRFAAAGLELTVQGQAQADAGAGEPIAVLNLVSRRTIEAVAIAPGLADIKPANRARLAAAN